MNSLICVLLGVIYGATHLEHPELTESSGVCLTQQGNLVWTHNDSGGQARLFGFRRSGQLACELQIRGVKASDWEDICAFQRDSKDSMLAIGDVGDNFGKRESVQIHVVAEPTWESTDQRPEKLVTTAVCSLDVTYPDGPVNCESLAYDPKRDVFVLASKETFRCRLFEVDASCLDRTKPGEVHSVQAKYVGVVALPLVTGADINSDGDLLVLVTYGPACLIHRKSGDSWQAREKAIASIKLPDRRQGESVCFDFGDQRLLATSEFAPTPLHFVPIPQSVRGHPEDSP